LRALSPLEVNEGQLVSRFELLGPTLQIPALGKVIGKGGRFSEELGGLLGVAIEFEQVPTWAKLVRTLAVEFGQDGAFVLG
jgi:hypothetical protein